MNFPKDRHVQLHSALRHDSVVGFYIHLPGKDQCQNGYHHEDPVFREEFRGTDQDLRHNGKLSAKLRKGLRQRRNDHNHDNNQNDNGNANDKDRIRQRRLDLRLGLVLLLIVLCHFLKGPLNIARFLTCADRLDQSRRKLRPIPSDAVGKSCTARNILRCFQENFPKKLVLRLPADHVQASGNRNTCAKRDGNLVAENGQVLQIDPVPADVAGPEGIPLLSNRCQREDDRGRCPDLIRRSVLVRGLHHTADLHAFLCQCLVLEC